MVGENTGQRLQNMLLFTESFAAQDHGFNVLHFRIIRIEYNLQAFVSSDSTDSGLATSWLIALTVAVYVSPIIKPVTVYEQQVE